jgi:hypothetical protein
MYFPGLKWALCGEKLAIGRLSYDTAFAVYRMIGLSIKFLLDLASRVIIGFRSGRDP